MSCIKFVILYAIALDMDQLMEHTLKKDVNVHVTKIGYMKIVQFIVRKQNFVFAYFV